jgi:cytochrome c peroxidase
MFNLNRGKWIISIFSLIILVWIGCHDTIDAPIGDLTSIPYHPETYQVHLPADFPMLEQSSDNLMTVEGITLGRKLFYDPILSIDSTISCSSCHQQHLSFTDGLDHSIGVAGKTNRSSPSLINIGLDYHGLFWDGHASTLEEQSLLPIEDPIEMGNTWENVEQKLRTHSTYPADFRKAFGIENTDEIDRHLAAKAISQFVRTIIAGEDSKYDRFIRGEIFLEENEYNGYLMFFNLDPNLPDAQCGHCHNAPLIATNDYFNNGLQEAATLEEIPDKGRGLITGDAGDNGKFKAPTLRNILLTAPYMHDGRFQNIQEVLDHYASGGKNSPNKSSFMYNLNLTESEKADIIAFLRTLTDTSVLSNPAFKSPF